MRNRAVVVPWAPTSIEIICRGSVGRVWGAAEAGCTVTPCAAGPAIVVDVRINISFLRHFASKIEDRRPQDGRTHPHTAQ